MRSYLPSGADTKAFEVGSESTIEDYTTRLCDVFDAIRQHLLHPQGSIWVNLGDSYAGSGGAGGDYNPGGLREGQPKYRPPKADYPAKCQMLAPHRFAMAMIDRGFILRNTCVWFKGREPEDDDKSPASNAMPSSVEDRLKNTYEYIFHFVAQGRYYYDLDSVRVPHTTNEPVVPWREKKYEQAMLARQQVSGVKGRPTGVAGYSPLGRNPGDLLHLPTSPFPLAHYACFPPALCHLPVKATLPSAVCKACGAPRVAVVEVERTNHKASNWQLEGAKGARTGGIGKNFPDVRVMDRRHEPSCTCNTAGIAYRPDDMEAIDSPTGERAGDDPSMITGRAGFDRPRGEAEGKRSITRYEQRLYAGKLYSSPHRAEMESEAGPAFAHYIRTERSGARPVPPDLLALWIERGWVDEVPPLEFEPIGWTGGIALDPFAGSGATAQGVNEARPPVTVDGDYCQPTTILIDLDERNVEIARRRLLGKAKASRRVELDKYDGGLFGEGRETSGG